MLLNHLKEQSIREKDEFTCMPKCYFLTFDIASLIQVKQKWSRCNVNLEEEKKCQLFKVLYSVVGFSFVIKVL